MSHTTKFEFAEYTVRVHHNSDWSGPCTVITYGSEEGGRTEVSIPGELLLALGEKAARQALAAKLMAVLEDE
jgi:hypothetical protein